MQARISMITLGVRSVPQAVRFYAEGLGLPLLDFPSDEVAFFTLQGSWLGLYGEQALADDMGITAAHISQQSMTNFRGVSLAHNLSSKQAVDDLMAQTLAAGATLIKKPQQVFWGGYSGYFSDLDNHIWELAYNPHTWIGPADMMYQQTPTAQLDIESFTGANWPQHQQLQGRWVSLLPLSEAHADGLFATFADQQHLWEYLPYGPFTDVTAFRNFIRERVHHHHMHDQNPQFYAVFVDNRPLGMASYLRINPQDGTIEIGHLCFSSLLQRSVAATEAMYLLINNAVTSGYRRIEYKCDARNNASRRAARRFGFSYEGIFRQAKVVKQRNRDTAWYALTDTDWRQLVPLYSTWLQPDNFDDMGNAKTRLSTQTLSVLRQFG